MNILVIGGGGREHTLAWKIKQSENCEKLYVSPGNAGTNEIAINVNLGEFDEIGKFCVEKNIELIVVGPEAPLVDGIVDFIKSVDEYKHIKIIGPSQEGAQLEGSKDFSKKFMEKHGIPTAKARTFSADQLSEAHQYVELFTPPIVLKADGLAAGKGVVIAESISQAQKELTEMLVDKKFGEASSKVLVEEFLDGIELSVFVLTDGKGYVVLPEAKDYKRIGEGDTGLNTGGMGAVSPVNFAAGDFLTKVEEQVIKPTIDGLKADNIDYKGFIFIGLMNVAGDPYVIEYNVRMGDPETEAVIPRVKTDLIELFDKTATGTLEGTTLEIDPRTATTVVLVAEGYPESYRKGDEILGLELCDSGLVFHAGTKADLNSVVTNGGRVLALTGLGNSIEEALGKSYKMAEDITWKGKNFRKDIGQDLLLLKK